MSNVEADERRQSTWFVVGMVAAVLCPPVGFFVGWSQVRPKDRRGAYVMVLAVLFAVVWLTVLGGGLS